MLKNAFSGVIIGVILFLASFAVLYWNEGRADLSDVAKKAVIIQADSVQSNTEAEGQLVSASGTVTAEPAVGDDLYLQPGPYLSLSRDVEVYAWVEKSETVTTTSSDGSESSETKYTYAMSWVDDPADSSDFHEPEGHTNPPSTLPDAELTADSAMLEQYSFVPAVVQTPEPAQLTLKTDMLSLTQNASLANSSYIYVRNSATGTYQTPQLGDERVSYQAVTVPFEGTLFGRLGGTWIKPFETKKGDTLYRVFAGSHEEGVAILHHEYSTALWIFRILGFVMMWFGLAALFGPVSALLSFIPILGSLGRAVIGFVTFAVALVLSAVTVIISAILHNFIAVIVVGVVLLAVLIGGVAMSQKNKQKLAPIPEVK